MAYKFSKGSQVIGDLKAEDDAQGDTEIDFSEDKIDLKTGGSTRLSIENNEITTTVPIHISGSVTEGLRIGKAGSHYREIQFETDGVDTAFIQVDSSEGLVIGCQSVNDEIIFQTTDGVGIAERMRIAANGKVGIGNTDPQIDLHIEGVHPRVRVESSNGSYPGFELSDQGTRKWALLNDPSDDKFLIKTDANTRFVIEQDGKVGIGSDSPSHKLDINGDIRVRGNDIRDNSGNPAITFDGSANTTINGTLSVNNYTLPASDGNNGQVLQTNGSGQLSFVDVDDGEGGGGGETPEVLKVGLNSDLTLQTGTYHTLALDVVQFDTFTGGAGWNTGSYNFVATEAGYYDIQAALVFDAIQSDITQYQIYLVSTSSASTTNSSGIPFIALNQYNNNPAQVDMRTFHLSTIAHFSTNQSASIQIRQVGGTSNSTKVKAGSNISYVTIKKL